MEEDSIRIIVEIPKDATEINLNDLGGLFHYQKTMQAAVVSAVKDYLVNSETEKIVCEIPPLDVEEIKRAVKEKIVEKIAEQALSKL